MNDELEDILDNFEKCYLSAFLVLVIYKNNKKLLLGQVQKPMKAMVRVAEEFELGDKKKAIFYKTLKVFLKNKNTILQSN
jgi:hypothetical protein